MTSSRRPRLLLLALLCTLLPASLARAAERWIDPTPAELSMTSEPKAPGAPAIYLFREQITVDDLHTYSVHARIKVFNDAGKDFGNVEIPFVRGGSEGLSVSDLSARTIHPDGTVIPFTGKPYDKLISKHGGQQYMARVFSLPDITPGSILEYRFNIRWDDHIFFPTDWYIQDDDLFTTRVHYLWRPTNKTLVTSKSQTAINTIAWAPILPAGVTVQNIHDPQGNTTFELNCTDIAPQPREEHMPPIGSLTYRVLFYYTPYRNGGEFWEKEGKSWAKEQDRFVGPGSGIRAAVPGLIAGFNTPEQKLRALYIAVAQIENTDYTREHSSEEDKAAGLKGVHTADDVWQRKRGNSREITGVFVSMARAAGFPAYVMSLTPRNHSVFVPQYLNLSQLRDDVAVVTYDGPGSIPSTNPQTKEIFLDPGVRFCPFGHLAWQHTLSGGLRQTPTGNSALASTPSEPYTASRVQRVADLKMDEHGSVTGTLTVTYIGAPALHWRQIYARNDEEALRRDLTESIHHLLPSNMTLKVGALTGIDQPEQPLVVHVSVDGPIGTSAGKRLLVPAALFESNTHPAFPHEKREQLVAFEYGFYNQDAVRIKLPPTLALESLPTASKASFNQFAVYTFTPSSDPSSFTVRRDYAMNEVLFKVDEYPGLRKFFSSMETTDQQSIVLKRTETASASGN